MKRAMSMAALASVVLAAAPAGAQEVRRGAEGGKPGGSSDGWNYMLQLENEFFVIGSDDDRYYTQGVQINLLTPKRGMLFADRARDLPVMEKAASEHRGGFVIGQNIYTPEDLTLPEPDPKDRPYAGWLYVGGEVITYSDDEFNSLQLQVGLVGPSALGGWAQNNWHKHVNRIDEAQGWEHQLRDEVAFVAYWERKWRPRQLWIQQSASDRPNPIAIDFTPHVGAALGTVQVSAGGGGTLRVGTHLSEDFGPPRIRPASTGSSFFGPSETFSWYGFAGLDVRAVGRDIFLDGNTFLDSRRVDRRPIVGELQVGAVVRLRKLRLTHAYVWRTEEFLGQRGFSQFASVTVGLSTADLLRRTAATKRPSN